jgi:hypothetical protein
MSVENQIKDIAYTNLQQLEALVNECQRISNKI